MAHKELDTKMEKKIYKTVSSYYAGKGLKSDEFSNRLYAVTCVFSKDWAIRDCIEFLDVREHWWEYEKEYRAKEKSKTRYQIKSILKKLGYE